MAKLKLLKRAVLGLILAALTVEPTMAQDEKLPDHKITEWSLGEVISGEEHALDKLKGKVVVIENWGYN